LGQRSKVTASTGRTYGRKRSDQTVEKTLVARGPSTYGSLLSQGRRKILIKRYVQPANAASPPCSCQTRRLIFRSAPPAPARPRGRGARPWLPCSAGRGRKSR